MGTALVVVMGFLFLPDQLWLEVRPEECRWRRVGRAWLWWARLRLITCGRVVCEGFEGLVDEVG